MSEDMKDFLAQLILVVFLVSAALCLVIALTTAFPETMLAVGIFGGIGALLWAACRIGESI